MKKFFTLFALLSVGLSAWAQPYVLTRNDDEEFSETMIANGDGTYSLRQLFYLTNGNSVDPGYDPEFPWFDPEYPDEPEGNDTEYVFWVGDICRASFWMGNTGGGRENGWYDITFTFDPSIPIDHYEGPLSITVNRYNRTSIFLSDDVTIGTYPSGYNPIQIDYIEYTRNCKNEWGTLCLPFDFQPFYARQFKEVTYYELKSATDEALVFSPIDESTTFVNAGTPLVFKLNNSNSDLIVKAWEFTLKSQAIDGDVIDGWKLNGTIEGTTISNGWVMQNNKILQIDPEETAFPIKPYRCWFTGPSNGAPLRIEVDETEGLQFVEQEDGTVKVSYDLQGRKLNEARKGLMIENGKVIMVK